MPDEEMKWRDVSLTEVEDTIAYPDKIERLATGTENVFKSIGSKLLRVSYMEEKDRIIVMSVVDKNK